VKHWPNVINGNLDKTARMKDALAMYDAVAKKYGSTGKPRVVGHSLGASIAQQVVRERPGSSGAGFNQGSSIFGSDKDLAKKCAGKQAPTVCKDFRQHRIGGDGVSASSTYYKTSNIQQTYKGNPESHQSLGPLGQVINPLKAHDMTNFTDPNSDFWSKAGLDAYYRKPTTNRNTKRRRRRGG
jgi:pimeloyl-ACP methyl ester carboxylesterase